MDVHGVSEHKTVKAKKEGKRRSALSSSSSSTRKRGVKVVYISSPMKVKTSASEFRMIVQELTGRDSDVVRIMESASETDLNGAGDASLLNIAPEERPYQLNGTVHNDIYAVGNSSHYPLENESPAEPESWVEGLVDGNLFSLPNVERSFRENNFPFVFQEPALLDVLI